MFQTPMVYDFNAETELKDWQIVNDGVMGGLSTSELSLTEEGHGLFVGEVRLEYNGGFASVRYSMNETATHPDQKVRLLVKGDGKKYQLRVRHDANTYYSYVHYFETTGEWETIEIPLSEMYPTFRGRKLDIPNFNHNQIVEVAILIGNKKQEKFSVLIDYIELSEKQ
jgi:hypothetical protein